MKKIFLFVLTFILCFISVVPVSYATDFPTSYPSLDTVPDEYNNYAAYVIYYDGGQMWLRAVYDVNNVIVDMNAKFITETTSNRPVIRLRTEGSSSNYNYDAKLFTIDTSTNNWKYHNSVNLTNNVSLPLITTETSKYYASSIDILNNDGTIFFPVPPTEITLAEAIQMVVEEQIPVTKEIIQNQMMTIVLCGVGCLALLISLALLVKALRRYLPL